ncbi:MAG: discoidin domain-containing protein [Acidimicrobiales bacterium]|nr:discoidin domain-containing protein [Acidimicrobiales bacterium]
MTRPAIALATAVLLLAGCGNGTDDTASIQPIEAILDSDIDIAVDPSGTTATLSVDTNIPVACAVIYGTDDTYGSIAVDNDMQGGAHHNHGPLLTGLEPDTEYQYVLQGSDAAGTIYRSDPMTFRTPPAADNAFGTNIAPTGTVTDVSSEFSDEFTATNAVDGDLGTEWSTDGDGDNAYIEIDLGRPQPITAIAFRTRQMTDGTAITDTFTVTIDDQTFGPYAAGTEPAVLNQPITAQIVRVDADQTTGGNTGATEIEIYASV